MPPAPRIWLGPLLCSCPRSTGSCELQKSLLVSRPRHSGEGTLNT